MKYWQLFSYSINHNYSVIQLFIIQKLSMMDCINLTVDWLKSMLIDLQPCRIDFSIEMVSGKRINPTATHKLGDYNEETHVIRVFSNRCCSDKGQPTKIKFRDKILSFVK